MATPNQFWRELHQRHADRQRRADQGADEGNERDQARDQADHEAELQPDQRQADAVKRCEAKADQGLAAQVSGDGGVGLVREGADGRRVVERQRAVDRRQHLGPVAQQVEGHHRRDEEQAEQVDDGDSTLRDTFRHAAQHGERLSRPLRRLGLDFLEAERRQAELLTHRLNHRLYALSRLDDVFRRLPDQRLNLPEQRRHDRHRGTGRDQHGNDSHDCRCPGPAETRALQARHDGIEEISDDRADHEGQQDVVQQPQQQEEAGSDAKPEAPAGDRRGHRTCNRHLSASLSSWSPAWPSVFWSCSGVPK